MNEGTCKWFGPVLLILALLPACTVQKRVRSNALDFVYPKGAEAAPPGDVTLQLPVRVGLAFAPPTMGWQDSFTESQKQELLKRIADAFSSRDSIQGVEVIASEYLSPGGGFENIDRLRAAFGIDLLALVSYDQFQFSDSTRRSWTYWTLVGAYIVNGEKNETRTVLNSTVYDIPSRTMLFNASGESIVGGRATPVGAGKALREGSVTGFSQATDDMIAKLDAALAAFQLHAAAGTVRGPGTPGLFVRDASGNLVATTDGAGAFGAVEAAALLLLTLAAGAGSRSRRRERG